MEIRFTLNDSIAALLRLSAERIKLDTGRTQTEAEIAKALVTEVLIDDAHAHGLLPANEVVN